MAEVNLSKNESTGLVTTNDLDTVYSFNPKATLAATTILVFSVVGNGLVMAAYFRDRRLRVVFNTLVVSFALADVIMSLVLVSEIIGISVHKPLFEDSLILCRFFSVLVNAMPTQQLILTHMMCNDRHKAFLRRLTYCQVRQQNNLRLAVAWAVSITVSFLITDIIIILEKGKMQLCFFPDRPLYVSKMAFIHGFMLLVLVISLIYILLDFRKQRQKRPYFFGFDPDLEPAIGCTLDNKTSSQCLIPRSPLNLYTPKNVSPTPHKAYHLIFQEGDKQKSGNSKLSDVQAFEASSIPSPLCEHVTLREKLQDWGLINESSRKQKNALQHTLKNLGNEASSVGLTKSVLNNVNTELATAAMSNARVSRPEKRVVGRRSGMSDRCRSETRKTVRILEMPMDKSKVFDQESRGLDRLEVEASPNSQDEWSQSSCSFSEDEPTDIPMPRFKPRTDSLYTLRSCMSFTEEATNFEAIDLKESPENSDDVDVRETEDNDNRESVVLTRFDINNTAMREPLTFGVSEGEVQTRSVIFTCEDEHDESLAILNSPSSDKTATYFRNDRAISDKQTEEALLGLNHAIESSLIFSKDPGIVDFADQTMNDKIHIDNRVIQTEQDKCNNYFGVRTGNDSANSLTSECFELTTLRKTEIPDKQIISIDTKLEKGHNLDVQLQDIIHTPEVIQTNSPSVSLAETNMVSRDWMKFYSVRGASSEQPLKRETENASPTTSGLHVSMTEEDTEKVNETGKCQKRQYKYIEDGMDVTKKIGKLGDAMVEGWGDSCPGQTGVSTTHQYHIVSEYHITNQASIASDFVEKYKKFDTESQMYVPIEREALPKVELNSRVKPAYPNLQEKDINVVECNALHSGRETVCPLESVDERVHTKQLYKTSVEVHLVKAGSSKVDNQPLVDAERKARKKPGSKKSQQSNEPGHKDEVVHTSSRANEASAKNGLTLTPIQLLESISISRRAYLAEIGLYDDILTGQLTLDFSRLQSDQCPQCPYCVEKEKSISWDEISQISSSAASSMENFFPSDTDKLTSTSLLWKSRSKQLKFLADSSCNNKAPSEHLRASLMSYYSKNTRTAIEGWCEASSSCPVSAMDSTDHFRIRTKSYGAWKPSLKKAQKWLSFETIKSRDPEWSIIVSLLVLIMLQLICWVPLTSLYIYYNVRKFPPTVEVQELHYILLWCTRMAVQPLVYAYYSKCFRRNFIFFLCCGLYNYRK